MPAELSGGMARRVALARVTALDPMLAIMYDEPFTGLDPISLGVIRNLVRKLNDALGSTSIVLSRTTCRKRSTSSDYVYILSGGRDGGAWDARGGKNARLNNGTRWVHQFVWGAKPTARSRPQYPEQKFQRGTRACLKSAIRSSRMLRRISHHTVEGVLRLGYATRFFALTLLNSGNSFLRVRLIMRELYFTGVLSMIIILVSGLFVGMVLGFQGYQTLNTYGSESALGVLVALSLVRELGPVVAALLFASRAGSAMTAEIGLMKATEQLSAMEMMAVDPSPAWWRRVSGPV